MFHLLGNTVARVLQWCQQCFTTDLFIINCLYCKVSTTREEVIAINELGKFLEGLRGKESLRDAAKRAGISHTYLRIVEKGFDRRSGSPVNPTPETLRSLSKAYNHSYEDLMVKAGYITKKDEDLEPHLELNNLYYEIDKSGTEKEDEVKAESREWKDLLDLSKLQKDIDLSDHELFEKYNFNYNGKPLTREATEKILDFIRYMADRGF